MTKNVSTCRKPFVWSGRWSWVPPDSTFFFFVKGLQTEDPVKSPFPLLNRGFSSLKRKIRSHCNRHAHADNVQTSVKCQCWILPNSLLLLRSSSAPCSFSQEQRNRSLCLLYRVLFLCCGSKKVTNFKQNLLRKLSRLPINKRTLYIFSWGSTWLVMTCISVTSRTTAPPTVLSIAFRHIGMGPQW